VDDTAVVESGGGRFCSGNEADLQIGVGAYGNVVTGDNDPVSVTDKSGTTCDSCVESAPLENGTHTFNIDVAVSASGGLSIGASTHRDSALALGALMTWTGVQPKLDAVKLKWDPTAQNPDGTYDGNLELRDPNAPAAVQVDANTIVVNGIPVVKSNGTTVIPFTAIALDGEPISGNLTVTTAVDTTTGQFADQTYAVGTQLQVVGCDSVNESFTAFGAPVQGAPPPPECKSGTFGTLIDSHTAYVQAYDGSSQISVLVGSYELP